MSKSVCQCLARWANHKTGLLNFHSSGMRREGRKNDVPKLACRSKSCACSKLLFWRISIFFHPAQHGMFCSFTKPATASLRGCPTDSGCEESLFCAVRAQGILWHHFDVFQSNKVFCTGMEGSGSWQVARTWENLPSQLPVDPVNQWLCKSAEQTSVAPKMHSVSFN